MATYANLRAHREALGWSIPELISKLEGAAISERSVRRLEDGYGIRPESAHKIFNAISKCYHEPLVREDNVKVVVSE
ncbi:hypothetical protein [Methylobacterium radiotolerans]|uniref:hypothetical protein n=1 Tax=Methylobacterium radiotolerans TaxID=31998 RepID=UPI0011BFE5F7|nr:hypothetical protein [Methylobacterium radiotolerans]